MGEITVSEQKLNQFTLSSHPQWTDEPIDTLIVVLPESEENQKKSLNSLGKINTSLKKFIEELIKASDFKGSWLKTKSSYHEKTKVVLLGYGSKKDLPISRLREIGIQSGLISLEKSQSVGIILDQSICSTELDFSSVITGFGLGIYQYPSFKLKEQDKKAKIFQLNLFNCAHSLESTLSLTSAMNTCRYLQDSPPNVMYPESIRQTVLNTIKSEKSIKSYTLNAQDLKKENCNAILAVGGGSQFPPEMLVLDYTPKTYKKTLVLVGKGITMDTGGYSLKPAGSMLNMKYDMSGAAVVLNALKVIAQLKLPIRVYAVAPLCENMVDATAYRVDDIIVGHSGKSIEIKNTDAEGRVILSDALSYSAQKLKADYILEFSTLTGAMVSALGHIGAGVFAPTDSDFGDLVVNAAQKAGERVWLMPSWEEVGDDTQGTLADVNNVGTTSGSAGSMIGAMFLKEFVHGKPFVHIDIAGVSNNSQAIGYPKKISSGFGIPLAVSVAKELSVL